MLKSRTITILLALMINSFDIRGQALENKQNNLNSMNT